MSKGNKKSKVLKGILIAAVVVLVLELALAVWLEKKQEELPVAEDIGTAPVTMPTDAEAATRPAETEGSAPAGTVPVVIPESTMVIVKCENDQIQTPYFPLYYPDALADLLVVANTAAEPFTLEFYAMLEEKPEQRIFDIRLSRQVKGNMGTVKTDAGDVYVDVTFYEFNPDNSWTKDEINTILAMQEAANDMLARLEMEDESSGQVQQPAVEETSPVSSVVNMQPVYTPYCTLQYPVRWKDYLVTEQQENEETGVYSVMFYGKLPGREKCLLFTILFGGDEGEQLGVIVNEFGEYVTVNLVLEELNLDGWSQEDSQMICTMQEAVNELIGQLPLE